MIRLIHQAMRELPRRQLILEWIVLPLCIVAGLIALPFVAAVFDRATGSPFEIGSE